MENLKKAHLDFAFALRSACNGVSVAATAALLCVYEALNWDADSTV